MLFGMRASMIDMESNTTLVQCYPAHEACVQPGTIRTVGFGAGARTVLLGACGRPDEVVACVAFSPQLPTTDDYTRLRCPVLLFYGGLDLSEPGRRRTALVDHLHALGKDVAVHVFREAVGRDARAVRA